LIHKLNGQVTIDVTDHQESQRELEGLLAIQIHQGPAMKVEVKDIVLKELPDGGLVSLEQSPIPADAKAMGAKPCWTGYIAVDDVEASADRVRDVADLAARRPDDRLDVGRPPPARRQGDPADDGLVEVDRFQVSGAERPNAIRSGERLALEAWHPGHCRSWRGTPDKVRGGPPKRTASMLSR
jgi:hypothetical protein